MMPPVVTTETLQNQSQMAVTGVDIPSMLIQILTVSLSLIYLY